MQMNSNRQEPEGHLMEDLVKDLVDMRVSMISSNREALKEGNHLETCLKNSRNFSLGVVDQEVQKEQHNKQQKEKILW